MSDEEVFEKWFKIAESDPQKLEQYCGEPEPWTEEWNQGMLFSLFPPDGAGLEKICQPYEHGDEVLERLRKVYAECAAPGDEMPSAFKRQPMQPESQEKVESLLREHAAGRLAIAKRAKSDDGIECAGDPPKLIRLDDEDDVDRGNEDDMFMNTELLWALESECGPDEDAREGNDLYHLTEPLYQWAHSEYAVAHYVLWPLERGSSGLDDPHEAAYELLKRGVVHAYTAPGEISYYMPDGQA